MTCFQGWTWEYIDNHMTIPRLLHINKYQQDNPPIHAMIASYFGDGKKSETNESGESLFDLFPVEHKES